MLDNYIRKQIEDFVSLMPRSIQEIAEHIKKNWRTVDRYVDEIKSEFSTIDTRTFRKGTRGALKIVYWASVEKVGDSVFQEKLAEELMQLKQKYSFSAFDIFQHVPDKNKKVIVEKEIRDETVNLRELRHLIKNTKKEVKIFSGNLSLININQDKIDLFKPLEELVKRGVTIKILCRVDITARRNIEKMLSLNYKYGKELVQIKHREQPLRAMLFDDEVFRVKEVKEPTGNINELDKKLFIFYTISDKDWGKWLGRIFNKMFNESIGVEKRMHEINKIFLGKY